MSSELSWGLASPCAGELSVERGLEIIAHVSTLILFLYFLHFKLFIDYGFYTVKILNFHINILEKMQHNGEQSRS